MGRNCSLGQIVLILMAVGQSSCTVDYDPKPKIGPDLEQLWEEGYGFNNPNYERIRKGQKPLKFGESSEEEEDDD